MDFGDCIVRQVHSWASTHIIHTHNCREVSYQGVYDSQLDTTLNYTTGNLTTGNLLPAAAESGPVAVSNRNRNAAITFGTVSPVTVLVSKNFDTSSMAASKAGNDVAQTTPSE